MSQFERKRVRPRSSPRNGSRRWAILAGEQGAGSNQGWTHPELWRIRWTVAEREEEETSNSCLFSSYTHLLPAVPPLPAVRLATRHFQGHALP